DLSSPTEESDCSTVDTEILSPAESPSLRRQGPEFFDKPNFSVDVEYRLRQANLSFMKDQSPDVMALRSVVLKGLPILPGDDSSEVYKTCFDTVKEEALASVTFGVLTVVNEDAQQQGLNAVHLQPIFTAIVFEGSTVMDNREEILVQNWNMIP
ncbi:hypothetical protein L3Q82_016996, partial [Scortum barcoo]